MISIKKTTTLWLIIVVLVLINLATLGSLWLSQPAISSPDRERRPERQGHFIEQRLNFTEEQADAYRQLRQEYFNKTKSYYDEIKRQKEILFELLRSNNSQNVKMITSKIGELQAEIELLTFEHFMQVRELSNEDQKSQFDSLMVRIVDRAVRPFPRSEGDRPDSRRYMNNK